MSQITINSSAYADDLAVVSNKLKALQIQIDKINKFCEWTGMELGVPKCAITGCPNKSKMHPTAFKAQLQATNITYRNQPIHVLHQNEPYIYLGLNLVPSLKWTIHIHVTTTKVMKLIC